jgi:aminobenzoyl-glutamate utilization protein B
MAMTLVDLLTNPKLIEEAWSYFRNEQTKVTKYQPLLAPEDKPATWLNRDIMARYREPMRKFYYDPSRHETYLDQLGIKYPTVKEDAKGGGK